jgi:cytochrome c-type biogenesis protein CcmH
MRLLFALISLVFAVNAAAVIESYEFDNDIQRDRYNAFIEELRCPKCQNQNLSGSDSEIARDLRRKVHDMIMADKSDAEITQYMLDRYGDFVLYRPRFAGTTAVLWLMPAALILLGLIVWYRMGKRRGAGPAAPVELDSRERERLASLLGEEDRNA